MTASPRRAQAEPDLDAEREVDVARYFDALVARWWLPVAGLLAAVALGYLFSLGSGDVFRAQTTVYLGTPYAPNGSVAVQGLAQHPSTVSRIVRSEATIEEVAAASGMTKRKLRAGISVRQLRSGLGRLVPSQLYVVSVQGDERPEVRAATAALAERVVRRAGGYASSKINSFRTQLKSQRVQLAALEDQIEAARAALAQGRGLSSTERLVLVSVLTLAEQRRATVEQDRIDTRQLLVLAEEVELPRVLDRAVATRTTARGTRNSIVVGGVLGLVLGLLAALLWEPVTARTARPAA